MLTRRHKYKYELLVELDQHKEKCRLFARYSNFQIGCASTKYILTYGSYLGGTAGNGLPAKFSRFTTYDKDYDTWPGNCAKRFKGGWWYRKCHRSNLNGEYIPACKGKISPPKCTWTGCVKTYATTTVWAPARGNYYAFKGTEMKLRPAGYKLHTPQLNHWLCHKDYEFMPCPKDCRWSQWGEWSKCCVPGSDRSKCCNEIRSRTRQKKPRATKNHVACRGPQWQTVKCVPETTVLKTSACTGSTPRDCSDIKLKNKAAKSGVYLIKLTNSPCNKAMKNAKTQNGKCCVAVYCDMTRFGGGWTVFQKRFNGQEDFYRNWAEYKAGFGSLTNEFYAGNQFLYHFTQGKKYEMLVELYMNGAKCSLYAHYASFTITNPTKYSLKCGRYLKGTTGDAFPHSEVPFSTHDKDNDNWVNSCSKKYKGGWWYSGCHKANLNGEYRPGCATTYAKYIVWRTCRGYYYGFARSEMKLRPAGCKLHDPNENENSTLCSSNYKFDPCPNDCHWHPWTSWSKCKHALDYRVRTRGSIHLNPGHNSAKCIGPKKGRKSCYEDKNECNSNPCLHKGICIENENGGYFCICPMYYTGVHCEAAMDTCKSNPCLNKASCTNTFTGYVCTCAPGYTGTTCKEKINYCAPKPCQHGGTCKSATTKYMCSCTKGYTGGNCGTKIDNCASKPCKNGGTCTSSINGYACVCPKVYKGRNCEKKINHCESKPCMNGATCVSLTTRFRCSCAVGYAGTRCEKKIDYCKSKPCFNGGSCSNSRGGYTCRCSKGYTGKNCDQAINYCESKPCMNGATCFSSPAKGYRCKCCIGYKGKTCKIVINYCKPKPCLNGGVCTSKIGRFSCKCPRGFAGTTCQIKCSSAQDLLFILDQSASMRRWGFRNVLKFVKMVVSELDLGITNIGVMKFSKRSRTKTVFPLQRFKNIAKLKKAIDNIQWRGGSTYIGYALSYSLKHLLVSKHNKKPPKGDRPGVRNTIIVVTDGHSHDDPGPPADEIRAAKFRTVAIGVTNQTKVQELRRIAADKSKVFQVDKFRQLNRKLKDLLLELVCPK